MIQVQNLSKYYGNKLGVNNVSFTIEKGEIVGLLGPNGAGKSTIMKMITGYMPPTSGTILVDGINVVENPQEAAKRIGFLPEIPPLYIEMSVEEYLRFIAEIRAVPKGQRAQHVTDAMELAKITPVKDRLIKNLSKGYRQRVGLAQALVGLPEILILDEPTVGLDPKQITEVRNLIQKLSKDHTIILSSHILSEINMICQKVIIISQGKMVAMDSMENLEKGISSGSLLIKLRGEEAPARAVLATIEGVKTVEALPSTTGDDGLRLRVQAAQGQDIREAIFYGFANAKLPILELRDASATLEEVFLQLTDTAVPPATTTTAEGGEAK